MTFSDIFKKSFLEGYSGTQLTTAQIIIVLLFTGLLGIYIFFCYRVLTRKTFYSKNFNISLVAMAIITSAIILAIQSSVVISLGMVGALSIVRFRTAIKDPMDLVFLFWSISVGIICGAGLVEIAIALSILVTVLVVALNKIPVAKAPKILVINATDSIEVDDSIQNAIRSNTKIFEEKTRRVNDGNMNLIYELRTNDGKSLVNALNSISGVSTVSLLSHDGEVTF
ncbi:MAG: DUF4956 domain-containing protein [Butyrivibrio sp.]|uniref:DUF4956 domain-containing protein n=1 Tax=Butyrivibrio proteoclasticus (strain ATCC 51982 / DSM 14932 / B316) TaxID=515622 RepID=E0RZZ8_BUTPB|nr:MULTISPECIES: DUF4956 domain-containing protein [Butyrivibrio]ADL33199.1 hypothetical protein bpr_I0451 [Butyrivibrio proteoclasticus B316]MBQ6587162.1 DUF4956 domain-containing protein [Butyrivibrio sp.]